MNGGIPWKEEEVLCCGFVTQRRLLVQRPIEVRLRNYDFLAVGMVPPYLPYHHSLPRLLCHVPKAFG